MTCHPEESAVIAAAVAFVEARAAGRWDVPAKMALVRAVDALVRAREDEEPCQACGSDAACDCHRAEPARLESEAVMAGVSSFL